MNDNLHSGNAGSTALIASVLTASVAFAIWIMTEVGQTVRDNREGVVKNTVGIAKNRERVRSLEEDHKHMKK